MEYIKEINAFQEWLMFNSEISTPARLLWYTLMHYNNKCGWKREFNVAMTVLEVSTGLSKNALIRARNTLKQAGRIEFVQRGNKSCIYTILPFTRGTATDTATATATDTATATATDTATATATDTATATATDTATATATDTIPRLDYTRLNKTSKGKENKQKKASAFNPPTLEEVRAYCLERNNSVDPEHFIDYYESNGWKVGKNKMKDWKASVRTWERNSYSKGDKSVGNLSKKGKQGAIDVVNRLMEKYEQDENIESISANTAGVYERF